MSEENPNPPSLRLKPRFRTDAVTPPPPFVSPSGPMEPPEIFPPLPMPEEEANVPLRTFSKTPSLPPEPARPPVPPVPLAELPPVAFPPPTDGSETLEVGRFKLKPRTTTGEASTLPALNLPGGGILGAPPGIKVVQSAPAPNLVPPKAPPFIRSAPKAPPPPPEAKKNFKFAFRMMKRGLVGVGLLAAAAVGVGGFLVFRYMAREEKRSNEISNTPLRPITAHPPTAKADGKPAMKGPVVANPKSTAGKLVAKAQDAIEQSEKASSIDDETDSDTDGTAKPPAKTRTAANATTPHGTEVEPSADLSKPAAKSEPVVVRIATPSAAFRSLIVNLKVSGVFQGEPSRALLNGRMVHEGEFLDNGLGIRFTSIDSAHKLLLFEDSSGATMQRRY